MASKVADLRAQGAEAYKKGNWMQAVLHYTEALAVDGAPERHVLLSNRCAALLQLHCAGADDSALGRATRDALEATRVAPRYAKAWARLGNCKARAGDHAAAVAALEKALDLDPSNAATRDALREARRGGRPAAAAREPEARTNDGGPRLDPRAWLERAKLYAGGVSMEIRNRWARLAPEHKTYACVGAALIVWCLLWYLGVVGNRSGTQQGSSTRDRYHGRNNPYHLGGYDYGGGYGGGGGMGESMWMVFVLGALYFAHKNGWSPFQLMMLYNTLMNHRPRGGYGGGYGGFGRRRGMFF